MTFLGTMVLLLLSAYTLTSRFEYISTNQWLGFLSALITLHPTYTASTRGSIIASLNPLSNEVFLTICLPLISTAMLILYHMGFSITLKKTLKAIAVTTFTLALTANIIRYINPALTRTIANLSFYTLLPYALTCIVSQRASQ